MELVTCDVFKSNKHPDMYLYVKQEDGLDRVPAELLERLGEIEKALTFELLPGRTLAREDAAKVYANLARNGFHLQMPPPRFGVLTPNE